jgi:pSer/pThr/pTyr-binding forkhead associated (FHA) protein
MSQTPSKQRENPFEDHLVVYHPNDKSEKIPIPEDDEVVIRIGRELDNDIVLIDLRASRHHAEIRRMAGVVEIKDLGSANGILINQTQIEPNTWTKISAGQTIRLAETRIIWQKAASSQSTVVMSRLRRPTQINTVPTAVPQTQSPTATMLPWAIGLGLIVVVSIVVGAVLYLALGRTGQPEETAGQALVATSTVAEPTATPGRDSGGNLALQTPVGGPTKTPTSVGPQLAIPVLEIISTQISPIIFGASPSTNRAYIFIDVRARNSGNIPFQFSISNFSIQRRDGQIILEAGATTSENYLRRLGAIDRFENLALTPGGSVFGSLVFEVDIDTYDAELVFQVPELSPLVLGLGAIDVDRELKIAAGTPVAALDSGSQTPAIPTLEPTPTATRPPLIPAPQVVPRSALVGTIAYPAFNGTDYDIYLGQVDGSGTRFFRAHASQPAFSPDGSRIAFHSWDGGSRGLVTMDVSGANPRLVGSFVEDQLPTWTADGSEIIFLSRRSGDRKSQLIKVGSFAERTDGIIIGEGEYPSVGPDNRLLLKGWGNTAFGLRLASTDLGEIETVTNVEEDTAPILSPDGQRIAFMSRREGNWDIYLINSDGSDLQHLTTDPAQDGLPAWSPDGNAIAFVSDRGGNWAVWVMTPAGKGQSQLFTMEGSPDGFVGGDSYASRGWAEERISWTK